jgi:hypothetical protein
VTVKNIDMLRAESAAVTVILLTEYFGGFFCATAKDSHMKPKNTLLHSLFCLFRVNKKGRADAQSEA